MQLSQQNSRLNSVEHCSNLPISSEKNSAERWFMGCKPRKKPFLMELQRKKHLAWAKIHQQWTVEQWSKVIFSDESNFFTTYNRCGRIQVRRRIGQGYKPECILPTVKHPTSAMIWGCFFYEEVWLFSHLWSDNERGKVYSCVGDQAFTNFLINVWCKWWLDIAARQRAMPCCSESQRIGMASPVTTY